MRRPFTRQRLSTRQELKDNCGGRRLLRPSTHTQAKYHQPHRSETHRNAGPWNPRRGHWSASTGGVHRTDDGESDAAGRGGELNDTDEEEAKGKEKEKTGELQGTGNPGESRRGGEGEIGDQNHHRMGGN